MTGKGKAGGSLESPIVTATEHEYQNRPAVLRETVDALGLLERHAALLERVTVLERALEEIVTIGERSDDPLVDRIGGHAREALNA